MLVVGVFGGLLSLATGIHAQSNSFPSGKNIPASQNAQLQHAPSICTGPIDLCKYSSDVLNCAICRERLGPPTLGPSTASANKTELMPPTVSNPTPNSLLLPITSGSSEISKKAESRVGKCKKEAFEEPFQGS